MKRWAAGVLSLAIAGSSAMAQEAQTLKERLSDKASDDQRVDNCHVPVERRGTSLRPDCPDEPPLPTQPTEAAAPAAAGAR